MPRSNYDYGGPLVDWPGKQVKPDWAALFPIPASKRIEDRPQKRSRREQQATADDSDDDDDFWLSLRMALRLVWAGTLYVDAWCRGEPDHAIEEMPPVVQPFAQRKQWMDAYEQAAMRLVRRLEKGMKPQPNCTAEEFALHRMVEMAEEFMQDGSSAVEDEIERLQLPRSTLDEDFARVSDAAFQDHDVLMLFDMPHLIHPSAVTQMMGTANLHPDDWFKPFKPHRIRDHV